MQQNSCLGSTLFISVHHCVPANFRYHGCQVHAGEAWPGQNTPGAEEDDKRG